MQIADAYNYRHFRMAGQHDSPAESFRRAPGVGQPAPGFALTDLHGQTVRLADLRGRPVVIEFGAIT